MLFISEILTKCGDWHVLCYFLVDPNGGFCREDHELWFCIEALKEDKYIKIGQNICWN